MKVEQLVPACNGKARFEYIQIGALPERPGCYVLTSFEGDILYIGQSKNVARRVGEHFNNWSARRNSPFWVFYLLVHDSHELDALERGWVNEYQLREGALPQFNSISPPL